MQANYLKLHKFLEWQAMALFLVFLMVGCRPFGNVGDPCEDNPCAVGLECVSGTCLHPPVVAELAPPCDADIDCIVNGSLDGRSCEDGQCVWTECNSDSDCGTRICNDGQCVERTVCLSNEDCKDGQICDEGACRSPCSADEDCTEGILNVCVDGQCRQSCFIDLLCFGDICVDGICVEPECDVDSDCGEDNVACEAGRCISFLGCEEDEDCFDPDYYCDEQGRCAERPPCQTDSDCGRSALCLGGVCRDAETCISNGDCDDDDECIAGRCVASPGCRSNADCNAAEACVNSVCGPITYGTPQELIVESVFGICDSNGDGACHLQVFPDERFYLMAGAFDAEQMPVMAEVQWNTADEDVATVDPSGLVTAAGPGTTTIALSHVGGTLVHNFFEVEVLIEGPAGGLRVLVVDGKDGSPLEGAIVYAGIEGGVTDQNGLAEFPSEPASDPATPTAVGAFLAGRTGLMVLDLPLTGDVRLALPEALASTESQAGFMAEVTSSGDELGTTGIGVALPCVDNVTDATLNTLFGGPAYGSIEVPILGPISIELPMTMMYETAIPLIGNQVVRDRAFVAAKEGRCVATALESRTDDGGFGDLLGGSTAKSRALDVADRAEGMDILLAYVGVLEALLLVEDGDSTNGIVDFDNDGDLQELVPDFGAMSLFELTPTRVPTERVGIRFESEILDSTGEVFVSLGLQITGVGFITTGLGRLSTQMSEDYQQVKVVPPEDWSSSASRHGLAEVMLNDASQSSHLLYRGEAFGPKLLMGEFLMPPEGAFVLEDLPSPGTRLLVLPGVGEASAYDFELETDQGPWRVIAASLDGGGRSVALPEVLSVGPFELNRIAAVRLAGEDSLQATLGHFQGGGTIAPDVRRAATAIAEVQKSTAAE